MLTDKIVMLIVMATAVVVGVALNTVRQEMMRRRREKRLYHMVRTGILTEEGVHVGVPTSVYSWKPCEDTNGTVVY